MSEPNSQEEFRFDEVEEAILKVAEEYPREARLLRKHLVASGLGDDPEARYIRLLVEAKEVAVTSSVTAQQASAAITAFTTIREQLVSALDELREIKTAHLEAERQRLEEGRQRVVERKDVWAAAKTAAKTLWDSKPVQFALMGVAYYIAHRLGVFEVMSQLGQP